MVLELIFFAKWWRLLYIPVWEERMFAVGGTLGAADVGVRFCPIQQIHLP